MLPILFSITLPPSLAPFVLFGIALAVGGWQIRVSRVAGEPWQKAVQAGALWAAGTAGLLYTGAAIVAVGSIAAFTLVALGSPAALKMGGRRPFLVARERDWVLARIAEKPDLTLRALLKELADRGLAVSYFALWNFLQHEGVTFKKKPSRLRAGPTGRRQAA